jgi:hypothetical protein
LHHDYRSIGHSSFLVEEQFDEFERRFGISLVLDNQEPTLIPASNYSNLSVVPECFESGSERGGHDSEGNKGSRKYRPSCLEFVLSVHSNCWDEVDSEPSRNDRSQNCTTLAGLRALSPCKTSCIHIHIYIIPI